jgi:hypothetical protein
MNLAAEGERLRAENRLLTAEREAQDVALGRLAAQNERLRRN